MKTTTFKSRIGMMIALFYSCLIVAQTGSITGKISTEGESIPGISVLLVEISKGGVSDKNGSYKIDNIKPGNYSIRVSALGFRTIKDSITIKAGQNVERNYKLVEDILNMGETVVTGTRNQIERHNSPVIVNTISNRTFQATQSLSVAEGLSFSPGLRLENNCQNCGFTQLRMNGLEGPYSQILINSRPVFSALAGVYGLEMLPANMVEKVEVVRGGGSVLYGGNAIAGTVNIITKDPIKNSFEASINQAFIDGDTPDRTVSFNGAVVSDDLNKGVTFFGFNRDRNPWDANGDGYSEIVKLRNNTFGFDAFWNTTDRSKLKLGAYHITEFRRGGNNFHLMPHQTDLTEQLQHNILSSNISYEVYSKDFKHKFSTYASFQSVNRDSYYGGGGRVLGEGDELTEDDIIAINAYGTSKDVSAVGGFQYNYEINEKLNLTAGTEYIFNDVSDTMPGYQRSIDQNVGTLGTYAQLEIKPSERLTFLVGGRFDQLTIDGRYNLIEDTFINERSIGVFVPRVSALYKLREDLKLRASFAQGYRGPQAFDEDLHIETVGGSARFIQLDPNLTTERSNSTLLSLNYDKTIGNKQFNFVVEGFYTELRNPFILSGQTELPNGVAVITKRNGSGATVAGVNVEANVALSNKLVLQSGVTFQNALFNEVEEIWAPEEEDDVTPIASTSRLLRTPNFYGFFSLTYNPTKRWSFSYSGVITGSMDIAHVIDPETEQTVIKSTPRFFENNIKVSYVLKSGEDYDIQWFGGVQNMFNSFQRDFDLGPNRDAGYVYGPMRPRTLFMGLKFNLN